MTFAKMTAVHGADLWKEGKTGIILCAREFQNSLDDSSMEEVKQAINSEPWLQDFYEVGERYIRSKDGRIRYAFAGLRHNLDSIKSKAKILLCWIDEAESVSEVAYQKLNPTIREDGSELWVTWNPETEDSPTDKRFRKDDLAGQGAVVEVNYQDNPWFPNVLELERQRDQRNLDPNTYSWIWEGAYLENSDRQILGGKWKVAEFHPREDWHGPYHGVDWGFSQDPLAGVCCWIHDDCLFIEHEAVSTKIELDATADFLKERIPGIEEYEVLADSANPQNISYVKRHGLPRIAPAKKWAGSVEDGIKHLRSYRQIVIHPRCKETAREARLYSYKVDEKSGQVLPKIVDAHNHCIDGIRYALDKVIRKPNAKPLFGSYGH